MSEKKIRKNVEDKLGRQLPDEAWNYLRDIQDFDVGSTYPDKEEQIEEILADFRKLREILHALYPSGAAPLRAARKKPEGEVNEIVVAEPSQLESLRAESISQYIGKIAELHPRVSNFREEVLSGRLLDIFEVYELLSSPAAKCLSSQEFTNRGISIVEHCSEHLSTTVFSNGDFLRLQIKLQIEGLEHPLTIKSPVFLLSHGWLVSEPDIQLEEMPEDTPVPVRMLTLPESVMGRLDAVSSLLVGAFGWDEMDAKQFVLTDAYPELRPVVAQYNAYYWDTYTHSRIIINVEPWVTTDTIAKNYLKVQRSVLGRRSRQLGERQLELYRFVQQIQAALPPRGKWEIVRVEWNEWCNQHKKTNWCYKHVKQLNADYHRTENALMGANK